jgi:aspartate kinase
MPATGKDKSAAPLNPPSEVSNPERKGPIVCKFGGTSLADADQIRKVLEIVRADPRRRVVVPSAPGKRSSNDQKITDMLYLCHEAAERGVSFDEAFGVIEQRFRSIANNLGVDVPLDDWLSQAKSGIAEAARQNHGPDFAASRGEHLNAKLIAAALQGEFVETAEVVLFNQQGKLLEDATYTAIRNRIRPGDDQPVHVVPGFYGATGSGQIKTFSRGGSDVTGAIVARSIDAAVYENWTDVSGLLMADPRIIDQPKAIATVTYRELRELSYSGATVLHDEAVFPVRDAGIPVNIRNTNAPDDPGTIIIGTADTTGLAVGTITGIAGRKDFTVISIEKTNMNSELGFGRAVLSVLERMDISFEHMPSGIDTLSVVVGDDELEGKLDQLQDRLRAECNPDDLTIDPDMALIATVGRGMASTPGMAARLFSALADAGVNIRMIDQGSSELNIITGVDVADFETAVRAIYKAFVSA